MGLAQNKLFGTEKLEINHSKTELWLNRKKPQTINLTALTTSDFRAQETKMSKAADMAKTTTKGGFHYLLGLVISTVISSVGTIFIAKMMAKLKRTKKFLRWMPVKTISNLNRRKHVLRLYASLHNRKVASNDRTVAIRSDFERENPSGSSLNFFPPG